MAIHVVRCRRKAFPPHRCARARSSELSINSNSLGHTRSRSQSNFQRMTKYAGSPTTSAAVAIKIVKAYSDIGVLQDYVTTGRAFRLLWPPATDGRTPSEVVCTLFALFEVTKLPVLSEFAVRLPACGEPLSLSGSQELFKYEVSPRTNTSVRRILDETRPTEQRGAWMLIRATDPVPYFRNPLFPRRPFGDGFWFRVRSARLSGPPYCEH